MRCDRKQANRHMRSNEGGKSITLRLRRQHATRSCHGDVGGHEGLISVASCGTTPRARVVPRLPSERASSFTTTIQRPAGTPVDRKNHLGASFHTASARLRISWRVSPQAITLARSAQAGSSARSNPGRTISDGIDQLPKETRAKRRRRSSKNRQRVPRTWRVSDAAQQDQTPRYSGHLQAFLIHDPAEQRTSGDSNGRAPSMRAYWTAHCGRRGLPLASAF